MVKTGKNQYIPERGDISWVNLNPAKGHKQSGKRPVYILSPSLYNKRSGLVLVCLITSIIKEYPFEVNILFDKQRGAILTDQVRAIDWEKRSIQFVTKSKNKTVKEVQEKISKLVL